MNYLKVFELLFLISSMIITLVCYITDDVKGMCFFGILGTWFFIDLAKDSIINRLK